MYDFCLIFLKLSICYIISSFSGKKTILSMGILIKEFTRTETVIYFYVGLDILDIFNPNVNNTMTLLLKVNWTVTLQFGSMKDAAVTQST